jgi:hypothetical protein
MYCLVCQSKDVKPHSIHDQIQYCKCVDCGSISVDRDALSGRPELKRIYNDDYWRAELTAARSRSYGSSINRVAELFLYARIPIRNFLDIGSGPGYLLDSMATLLPNFSQYFWGVELFPPPKIFQSQHQNYIIGQISDLRVPISAGVCIEVIEHLYPDVLEQMLQQLAAISEPQAIFFFNSGQPEFVDKEDPNYLDPFGRGHVISYSIKGLRPIFIRHGFTIFRLPGRSWGFLAEYQSQETIEPTSEVLLSRLWTAHSENKKTLQGNLYGSMINAIGIESAVCYLEADRANNALLKLKSSNE